MLRRMCKVCKENRPWVYDNRQLTGEVVKKFKNSNYVLTLLMCKTCGHTWTYCRSKKNSV